MRWIEACLQRCSVAYKCVPSRFACYHSYSYSHPRILSISFSTFFLSMHANHSFGLGFYVWCYSENRQTDRHTLQPNEKGTTASTEREKIWRFARFCVVNFIWNTKMFGIHLLMLFHLRMGIEEKKKRLLWFQLKKNELKFDFFLSSRWRCVCMNAKRWAIGEELGIDQD